MDWKYSNFEENAEQNPTCPAQTKSPTVKTTWNFSSNYKWNSRESVVFTWISHDEFTWISHGKYHLKFEFGVSFTRGDFACASDINQTCSRRNNSTNSWIGGGEQNSIVSGADYQYGVALPLIWHNSLHCLSATWRPPVNRPLTSAYQRHLFLFRC